MSFSPTGTEIHVNAVEYSQAVPVVTELSGGGYAVVWESSNQDGNGRGIYAQRYDSDGMPQGGEVQVNSYTTDDQSNPSVAALSDGGFVVTWTDGDRDFGYGVNDSQDGSGQGVFGQRFDDEGVAAGTEFQVNSFTTDAQNETSVAGLNDGGFVVTWTSEDQDGDGQGIFAQRYDSDGMKTGTEFQVNTSTESSQYGSEVTELANGGFIVVWTSFDPNGNRQDVYGQQFDSSGDVVGTEFLINSIVDNVQTTPSVTALDGGGFVVVWETYFKNGASYGVAGQRYDANGDPIGGEFTISTENVFSNNNPSVSSLVGGGFVVTWDGLDEDRSGVFGQAFDGNGIPVGGEFQINSTTSRFQDSSSVTGLSNGDFIVFWDSVAAGDDYSGIAGQLFTASTPAEGTVTITGTVREGSQLTATATDISDADGITGITDGWRWLRDGEIITSETSNTYSLGDLDVGKEITAQYIFTDDSGAVEAVSSDPTNPVVNVNDVPSPLKFFGATTQGETLTAEVPIDDDGIDESTIVWQWMRDGVVIEGATSESYTLAPQDVGKVITVQISFTDLHGTEETVTSNPSRIIDHTGVVKVGNETLVNTETDGTQFIPNVTRFSNDGSYVVTWTSEGQDGDGTGVYAQLFDGTGVPVGGEFLVNTTTDGDQNLNKATSLVDGGFVVTWRSGPETGDTETIRGQRYDSHGDAVGGEFTIATTNDDIGRAYSVASLTDGGFVVVWDDNTAADIYGQRYNADGSKAGGVFDVNTTTYHDQEHPDVIGLSDGGFLVTWDSVAQDGSNDGVIAQRFDASGDTVGNEFIVNTFTTNSQSQPKIEVLADGGFVIAWTSQGQDGSSAGVYAQQYDSDGDAVGDEFRVNTETISSQFISDIAMLDDGGYVITWLSYNQDGDSSGIFVRRYDADGVAVGGEVQVNTFSENGQFSSTIENLNADEFLITWHSQNQDGSGNGVYSQRFTLQEIPSGSVTVSGTPTQGEILTADASLVEDADGIDAETIAWRWLRDGKVIEGATSETYQLTQEDVGKSIVAGYSFTDDGGHEELVESDGTAPIGNVDDPATGMLSVVGDAVENVTLVADISTIEDLDGIDPETVEFQWLRDGEAIDGATGATFTLGKKDVGGKISVTYAFEDDYGESESFTSQDTIRVLSDVDGATPYLGTRKADLILANDDANDLRGRAGKDSIYAGGGDDTANGANGSDRLFGEKGHDVLIGGRGGDHLFGGGGNDMVRGDKGDDDLEGAKGLDALIGGVGKDRLTGGSGKDTLNGGADQDWLKGGKGADVFEFTKPKDSAKGSRERDKIVDFDGKKDKIDLSDIDAKVGSGNQDFTFIGKDEFSESKGELRYKKTDDKTIVQADRDGDGIADFEIELKGGMNLQEGDFIL